MRRIIGGLTAFIAGWIGWWLGARVGQATGFILGTVASGAGLWMGYRWFDEHLG